MDPFVFIAVLAAAACHAGWNTLLKLRLEPVVATSAGGGGVRAGRAAGRSCDRPARAAAWPYLLASVAIHMVYYLTLARPTGRATSAKSIRSRAAGRR